MKGIYLTEEGKKEIEAEIVQLEQEQKEEKSEVLLCLGKGMIGAYKDILSSASILPVEDSWGKIIFNGEDEIDAETNYPQGVIIKPKQ
jgi:hypothetical protein